jgi:hypothetical protein
VSRFRLSAAASISLALFLLTFTVAPVFAECFPPPPAGSPIDRPYAFTATVRDITTEVDQQSIDLGEGPGVRWRTTLDVTHAHRGSIPEEMVLSGTTSEAGNGGGCTYFLGDRVTTGETLFIALDKQVDLRTNSALFGNLLLWRQGNDGWEFHEAALQGGAVPGTYPAEARDAHTTAQVLAAIGSLAPDTATAAPAQDHPEDDWTQVAAMVALALILTSILRGHGPWLTRRDR